MAHGNETHGMSKTGFYASWNNMIARCYRPKTNRYERYGGIGITVCEEWKDFNNFHADMINEWKDGLTIDRKDNTKNYANAFGAKFNFPKDIEIVSIKDKEELTFFNESFKLILTPGHTKGSICIKYNQWFFSGDTIFIDSIGRTDLFSGNSSDMQKSLEYLKKKLSNQTIIYPGHGRYSKWKDVKRVNPYIK